MQIYAKMLPFVRPYTPEFCHNDSENHPFYVFMNLLFAFFGSTEDRCKRQVLLDKLGVRTKTWTYKSGGSPCIPTRNE